MAQQRKWAIYLFQFAAIFGVIGAVIGSKMSGNMDYSLRPIHAHVLLVGWLSVFVWGLFYYIVPVTKAFLVKWQSILGMLGAFGLSSGMWFYNLNPFNLNETLMMIYFIVGGTLLLIAFILFAVVTFFIDKKTN